ncbi:hypothetical protein DM01DRAFT_1408012 [Hesseltinella vesiculosa]|uniref:Uncharacterized protein n=1 Tax=Hesseltinella vesiculosa TaxID=101127 RepID=A0A1X2GFJ1_9FUNG|nr:hypothetical protein DM01DRAFT_1408012 [Hesseltinella vesiculosa]
MPASATEATRLSSPHCQKTRLNPQHQDVFKEKSRCHGWLHEQWTNLMVDPTSPIDRAHGWHRPMPHFPTQGARSTSSNNSGVSAEEVGVPT